MSTNSGVPKGGGRFGSNFEPTIQRGYTVVGLQDERYKEDR